MLCYVFCWNFNDEAAAESCAIGFDPDLSVMGFGDGFADIQTKARASDVRT